MRRPLLMGTLVMALAAGVPLLFDEAPTPLAPLPALPPSDLAEVLASWPEAVEGSARWARLAQVGESGAPPVRGLPRHEPLDEAALKALLEATPAALERGGAYALLLDRFADLEPALAAHEALQDAGFTSYVLPVFPRDGSAVPLGFDLALGPRLNGAVLWAQREALRARYGYDGELVRFHVTDPEPSP
jgi:cell division septation protein DedD